MQFAALFPAYYDEYLEITEKIIREDEHSVLAPEIVLEIESHQGGLEEKERMLMSHSNSPFTAALLPDYSNKISMEDKVISAYEEEYPTVQELTPGEISIIVERALRDLPEALSLRDREGVIHEICFTVAYEVMGKLTE